MPDSRVVLLLAVIVLRMAEIVVKKMTVLGPVTR